MRVRILRSLILAPLQVYWWILLLGVLWALGETVREGYFSTIESIMALLLYGAVAFIYALAAWLILIPPFLAVSKKYRLSEKQWGLVGFLFVAFYFAIIFLASDPHSEIWFFLGMPLFGAAALEIQMNVLTGSINNSIVDSLASGISLFAMCLLGARVASVGARILLNDEGHGPKRAVSDRRMAA